jgi:hypothetical protein
MSNGDGAAEDDGADGADGTDAGDDGAETGGDEGAIQLSADELEARLDDVAEELEAAETEDDLDAVEASLDEVEGQIEAADLPEPEDEDEDEEDPRAALEDRVSSLRDDLEAARGPYVDDVVAAVEAAEDAIEEGEWTEDGEDEVVAAVAAFLETAAAELDEDLGEAGETPETARSSLVAAREAIDATVLDPDDDAETIEGLLGAAETLQDDLDAAEEWNDLTVREQLAAEGFYDVLTPENRKDFPAEWNAIKIYADRGEAEPIVTALERFESDFMVENALDALEQIAPDEAFDQLHAMAQKRSKHPIRILGRIGDERACDTLHDFLGGGDVALEKATLQALGTIGSEASAQPVANRLDADNLAIRSIAARSLGMIGDTRAIEPLSDVLEDDDADEVRASAAWALNRIGTEAALEEAAQYTDDTSYIVQAAAERAAGV